VLPLLVLPQVWNVLLLFAGYHFDRLKSRVPLVHTALHYRQILVFLELRRLAAATSTPRDPIQVHTQEKKQNDPGSEIFNDTNERKISWKHTFLDSIFKRWSKTSDAPSSNPNRLPNVDSRIALPSLDIIVFFLLV
jgi:hypothetical protein